MRRLERIEQRLCRVQQRMRKSQMRGDIQRFHETGQLPQSEPAASFVNLLQAFDRVVDASVGGGDYDQARADYEAAVNRWEKAERGIEWTA